MKLDLTQYPVMNPTFTISEVESTDSEATLVIEPLEQGYGHTLGNALRRVLLSSLPGAAITAVRIDGIDHQFSSLDGMSEDVVEFILNLKLVRIRATVNEPGTIKLEAKGEGDITAASLICSAGYEVINTDQHLATLAKGKSLKAEMVVEVGVSYAMARDRQSTVVGEIPVDALFSPVTKVSYEVEATRVGRRTDFDKILLTIQTDGSVRPIDAVKDSARILARQFTQVFDPVVVEVKQVEVTLSPEEAETLKLTVEELDLPTRIANALRKGGFQTVGDLLGAPRMTIAKVKNLGEKSVDVINEALQKKGVTLGE